MQSKPIDSPIAPNPVMARVIPDKNLRVTITSDKGDYEFQIYTERAAKDADQSGLRRSYALIEIAGGAKARKNARKGIVARCRLESFSGNG